MYRYNHLRESRRTGTIIYESQDVPVQSFTSVKMYRYNHLRESKCIGTITYKSQDVPVQSFTSVKMYRYNHLRESRRTGTIIYESQDVPVQSFTRVKMYRYNHLRFSRCTGTIIYERQDVGTSVSKKTSNGLDDRDFVPSSRLAPKHPLLFWVSGSLLSELLRPEPTANDLNLVLTFRMYGYLHPFFTLSDCIRKLMSVSSYLTLCNLVFAFSSNCYNLQLSVLLGYIVSEHPVLFLRGWFIMQTVL